MKQALSFGTLLITPIVMTMLIMSCGSGEDGGIDSPRLDLLTAIDQGKTDIVGNICSREPIQIKVMFQ